MRGMAEMVDLMMRSTNDRMSREEIITTGLSALERAGYTLTPTEGGRSEARRASLLRANSSGDPRSGRPGGPLRPAFHAESFLAAGPGWRQRLDWKGLALGAGFVAAVGATLLVVSLLTGVWRHGPSVIDVDTHLLQDTRPGPGINWGGTGGKSPPQSTPGMATMPGNAP